MLREQVNVTRIEPLRFVETRLALIPPALPTCHVGEVFRDAAAIREELTRLLEKTRAGVVILQASVVIIALGQDGLAEIGLKPEGSFGGLPCFFPQSGRWLKTERNVTNGVDIRE